jgi:hypothetical protein
VSLKFFRENRAPLPSPYMEDGFKHDVNCGKKNEGKSKRKNLRKNERARDRRKIENKKKLMFANEGKKCQNGS